MTREAPAVVDRSISLPLPMTPDRPDWHQHVGGFLRQTIVEGDIPSITERPQLWMVVGPPVQFFLTTSVGKIELGWMDEAAATADLTLTTSNVDVVGATLVLPHIGPYHITAAFDFNFTTVPASTGVTTALGVLTDDGDVEVSTPRAAIKGVPTLAANEGSRGTYFQHWNVVTTAVDTEYKLMARKSRTVGLEVVKVMQIHTVLAAKSGL